MTMPQARKSTRSLRWFPAGRRQRSLKYPTVHSNRAGTFIFDPGSLLRMNRIASAGAPDHLAFAQGHHLRQSNPHSG
jgi:hypothetical protein